MAGTENTGRSAKVEPLRKARPCPECRRPSQREH
jgi:hypothetical protein